MSGKTSLAISTFIHFILKVSLFIDAPNSTVHLMKIPSVFILASVYMVLNEIQVIPHCMKELGKKLSIIQILLEAIAYLFIIELIMLLVWTRLESIVVFLLTTLLTPIYKSWSNFIANCIILVFSLLVLAYISMIRGYWDSAWEKVSYTTDKLKKIVRANKTECMSVKTVTTKVCYSGCGDEKKLAKDEWELRRKLFYQVNKKFVVNQKNTNELFIAYQFLSCKSKKKEEIWSEKFLKLTWDFFVLTHVPV